MMFTPAEGVCHHCFQAVVPYTVLGVVHHPRGPVRTARTTGHCPGHSTTGGPSEYPSNPLLGCSAALTRGRDGAWQTGANFNMARGRRTGKRTWETAGTYLATKGGCAPKEEGYGREVPSLNGHWGTGRVEAISVPRRQLSTQVVGRRRRV